MCSAERISYHITQNKKPLIPKNCFWVSILLLYLKSSSEEWYSCEEGRQEILRQMNIPLLQQYASAGEFHTRPSSPDEGTCTCLVQEGHHSQTRPLKGKIKKKTKLLILLPVPHAVKPIPRHRAVFVNEWVHLWRMEQFLNGASIITFFKLSIWK